MQVTEFLAAVARDLRNPDETALNLATAALDCIDKWSYDRSQYIFGANVNSWMINNLINVYDCGEAIDELKKFIHALTNARSSAFVTRPKD